jgi:serine/threonine-protein kinase
MSPQQSIAHYRIISKLGEGGMGEVWRATDTKLNRDVAIKVLPQAVAADPDRLVRFTREAQVLASLNHPNIAAIYGVEERALIMELVEGPTLAERIAQGPVPLEESILIAKQLAEALEYAHDRGVIHRDLKPANIKITPEGRVKVLDFGLAKALSNEPATLDPKSSPTITMRATLAGTIMGTAAYMSPEQARGQTVDRRADIWAFGVVLYEMVIGGQLFNGATVSDTLAEVLRGDLDLSGIPAGIRPVMERCLRRDPKLRWRSIGDVFAMLEEGAPAAAAAPVSWLRRSVMAWIVTGLALALGGAGWWRATRPMDHPFTLLSVDLGPDALPSVNLTAAISPDGRRLIYRARGPDGRPHLAMRLLDQALPTLLPGTENGSDPFFSPDSQSIGFFAGLQLKTMSVQGGSPVTLWSAQGTAPGGSWGSDGDIITATGSNLPLSRIPSAGGTARPLTKLGPHENSHRWPQVLPGGKAALFTASPSSSVLDRADIEAVWLKTGQVKIVSGEDTMADICPAAICSISTRALCSPSGSIPRSSKCKARPCHCWPMLPRIRSLPEGSLISPGRGLLCTRRERARPRHGGCRGSTVPAGCSR